MCCRLGKRKEWRKEGLSRTRWEAWRITTLNYRLREHKRKCKYNGQMNIELTTTETGPVTEGGIENHHAYPVGAHAIGKGLEGKRKGEVGTKKTQILERN